ncbi:Lysosomal-associated transmembrane protein 4B [Acipenser ruthenus]|uniref:Lysosomal-associated transmembrane protein 4B n=1 Tax=Acipenser ruthenus TaxID=7906 RepID=A0A444TZW6_ACIRT|nr:Lysosomal-associated transmembrane protein 4B [Acipenser ruthenus]
MISPWDRWYSSSCCLCCHVRTGTIILGVWYMIINAVVLLILLSALSDPDQYHITTAELGNEFDFMDDANICIATAISLLMILICGMATYGAYKQHAAWIIPFFCYQIFDFALNTLVAISVVVYPTTIQDYLQQLPGNFPYKEEIMSMNATCLVLIVLMFIGGILAFKAYLIACVWNCYQYVSGRGSADVLVYVTTNDTTGLFESRAALNFAFWKTDFAAEFYRLPYTVNITDGITIYAVRVGKAIEDELREIASKPQDKHLHYAEDLSRMDEIAENSSLEDQCKCENVIGFQDQANEPMRKLPQRHIL